LWISRVIVDYTSDLIKHHSITTITNSYLLSMAFKSLNSLIVKYCIVLDAQNLYISSVTLVNSTIVTSPYDYCKVVLSTPKLCGFNFMGIPNQKLCFSKSILSSIKNINIHLLSSETTSVDTPLVLLNGLVELANIESLTLAHLTYL